MSTLKTNAITDILDGNSTTINGILVNAGALQPDDRIINGDFGIWQRNTISTAGGYVAADRWIHAILGGTVTMSRQSFTVGSTLGVNSPTYFLRQTVSSQSLPSQYAQIAQRIEGVRSYAGQTITVLGWARRSSGAGNMTVEGAQEFGGVGTPANPVTAINSTIVPLTATWAPFAVVLNVPGIAGKTLGTNGKDSFTLVFWTSAGADWNTRANNLGLQTIGVDLWGIHIKRGIHTVNAIDLYCPRDPGTELALCQRYYEKSYDITTAPGTNVGTFGSIEDMSMPSSSPLRVRFAVSKQSVPAMTVYDAAGTVNRVTAYLPAQTNNTTLSALDNFGNSGFKVFLIATGLSRLQFHWTADAEL